MKSEVKSVWSVVVSVSVMSVVAAVAVACSDDSSGGGATAGGATCGASFEAHSQPEGHALYHSLSECAVTRCKSTCR